MSSCAPWQEVNAVARDFTKCTNSHENGLGGGGFVGFWCLGRGIVPGLGAGNSSHNVLFMRTIWMLRLCFRADLYELRGEFQFA